MDVANKHWQDAASAISIQLYSLCHSREPGSQGTRQQLTNNKQKRRNRSGRRNDAMAKAEGADRSIEIRASFLESTNARNEREDREECCIVVAL